MRTDVTEPDQLLHLNAKLLCIASAISPHQIGRKTIEGSRNGSMSSEDVTRTSTVQCRLKALASTRHEAANPLERGKSGVPFVKVTDLAIDIELFQQTPTTDPEHQLLLKPQFRTAPVKLSGNSSIARRV